MKVLVLIVFIFCSHILHTTPFQVFSENGKMGIRNGQGQVVVPPSFDALGWSDGSFSVIGQITGYKLNGSWGLINLKKEYITKAEFESLTYSGSDRVVAIKNMQGISRKAGSLKLTGEITIPFIYDDIDLHGLRAVVMNKVGIHYRFGLTDLENHALLPLEYNNIYPLSTLRFAVENKDGRIALFSDNGKPITDFFIDSISVFHRGHAIIHSGGRQGVIDAAGGVLVAPAYGEIKFLPDGKLRALQPDGWKVIDDKNKEVRNIQVDGLSLFRDGYYRITLAGKQGLIDQNLLPVWPAIFDRIDAYKDGLVAAKKNNKWGLIDITLKEALPFAFDSLLT